MVHCLVVGCRSCETDIKNGISFFRLPKSIHLVDRWLVKLRRDVQATKFYKQHSTDVRVCSLHFTSDDFVRDMAMEMGFKKERKQLKADAVPSLFLPGVGLAKPRPASQRRAAESEVNTLTMFYTFTHNHRHSPYEAVQSVHSYETNIFEQLTSEIPNQFTINVRLSLVCPTST
jgi:hypothetical protein